jgi:hypothetical protein
MSILETSWQGEAVIYLETHTLLQTRKNTRRREFGVGCIVCIVCIRCKENILGFQPISERICTLRMERKFINITFIHIHGNEGRYTVGKGKCLCPVMDMDPSSDVKIILGARMPKSDKKENITQLQSNQFAKHI